MEIIYLFITSLIFLKIAYVDYKEHYIYDLDIAFAVAVILVYNLYLSNFKDACIGGIIGFLIGYAIYGISYYVYKEEAFGFGDVLFLGVLGLFFGFPTFLHYFSVTIMATGVVAAVLILFDGKYRKLEVPMAPVFVLGAVIYVICGYPNLEDIFFHIFLFYYSLV